MPFGKKSVFILGAGSSEKFPLGYPLVREIISDSIFSKNPSLQKNGVSESEYLAFLDQLRFADPSSIDAFLEENDDLIHVGRLAIAYNLMKREDELELFPPKSSVGNWYKKFADALGVTKYGKPPINDVTVFTYNYERSLEHYLTKVIQKRMRIEEEEARGIRKKIPIYHLHGSLGSLEKGAVNFRPYSNAIDEKTLKIAADSIKIIHEQLDEYDCQQIMRQTFRAAEKIFFFGFGYHPVNMRRLMNAGLREKLLLNDSCEYYTLHYRIEERFWTEIKAVRFEGLLRTSKEFNWDIDVFLNHFGFDNS